MPSKEYLNYKPLVEEEKKEKKEKDTTGYVTKDIFQLQFGYEYPKVPPKYSYVKTIKYPKTDGSNGKISTFR
tara:strand:- start:1740 stop:1955 length:216 start_codon:yes stop_codon:yes gene_type:complete